jgi:hypothetical protein
MKTFYLKTKLKETIKKIDIDTLESAIKYFCEMKKMSKKDLLTVFIVTEK